MLGFRAFVRTDHPERFIAHQRISTLTAASTVVIVCIVFCQIMGKIKCSYLS